MRKVTTILLLISLFSISFVYANTFSDVSENHWAYSAIDTMVEKKIIDGYPNGTFLPEKLITRAEFAKILVETLNLQNMYEEYEYIDVPYEFWAYGYISTADQYFELVSFESGDMFYPNRTLTREEVASIIVKAMWLDELQYNDETLEKVLDNDEISDGLKKYVAIAYEQKLMNGNADGTFNPKGSLTRAEVCQLMKNVIEIKKDEQVLYDSLAGRWLPEKAYDNKGKKVSLKKVFDFEITDKNKLVLNNDATFADYLYGYYEEQLINLNYGSYIIAVDEIILRHNAYVTERIEIKEEKNIKYLVREIEFGSKNGIEQYKVYYKLQDKKEIITDVIESSTPKKDELIDNTTVKIEINYYDEIKSGKLKITNSKKEIVESNTELEFSTISTTIECEPNETYTVTAYEIFDMNGYKLEDYTYGFSISEELANLGPQYREYSSKKVTTKYKLEDYPLYRKVILNLLNSKDYKFEGYKLYDLDNDEEPELLVGIDGKIRAIYWIKDGEIVSTGITGPASINLESYYEICENNIILKYIETLANETEFEKRFTRSYYYKQYSESDTRFYEYIEMLRSTIYEGKIDWKKLDSNVVTYNIEKEEFYDTLDKYKILKIELDNYTID